MGYEKVYVEGLEVKVGGKWLKVGSIEIAVYGSGVEVVSDIRDIGADYGMVCKGYRYLRGGKEYEYRVRVGGVWVDELKGLEIGLYQVEVLNIGLTMLGGVKGLEYGDIGIVGEEYVKVVGLDGLEWLLSNTYRVVESYYVDWLKWGYLDLRDVEIKSEWYLGLLPLAHTKVKGLKSSVLDGLKVSLEGDVDILPVCDMVFMDVEDKAYSVDLKNTGLEIKML